jgi:hypothetical protein
MFVVVINTLLCGTSINKPMEEMQGEREGESVGKEEKEGAK